MRNALKQPRFWLGGFVSVAAVIYAVRGVSWADLVASLEGADYVWLIPGLAVIVGGQAARAVRWRALFGHAPRPDLADTFRILSVGYMVSAVLPFRLGDPVRAWLVDTRSRGDGATALGTIMVERAVDMLMIAVLVALIVPAYAADLLDQRLGTGPWSQASHLGLLAFALVGLGYLGILVAATAGRRLGGLVASGSLRLGVPADQSERLGRATARFAAGLAPLQGPATLTAVTAWTLCVWLLGATSNWVFLRAFVPEATFGAALVVLGTTAVLAILPSSPGYTGVFHSGVVIALASIGGISRPTALAYAIVLHGVTIATLIVVGILCLWAVGMSGRDLTRHLEEAEADRSREVEPAGV